MTNACIGTEENEGRRPHTVHLVSLFLPSPPKNVVVVCIPSDFFGRVASTVQGCLRGMATLGRCACGNFAAAPSPLCNACIRKAAAVPTLKATSGSGAARTYLHSTTILSTYNSFDNTHAPSLPLTFFWFILSLAPDAHHGAHRNNTTGYVYFSLPGRRVCVRCLCGSTLDVIIPRPHNSQRTHTRAHAHTK